MTYSLIKSQYQENKRGWRRSFMESFAQDFSGAALPWMTYPFIEFISAQLRENHEIFEFGFGASTLFFAKRVKKVMVIESNSKWCEIMQEKAAQLGLQNIEIILMTDALTNSNYENAVKNSGQKFDFIIVDSLKRFQCAKNSYQFLKQGGALILDDSQRFGYKKIFKLMEDANFYKQDFWGIAPGQFRLKNTTYFSVVDGDEVVKNST